MKSQLTTKSVAVHAFAAGIGVVGVLAGTTACNPVPVAVIVDSTAGGH